jgi:serine/threonine protein kinase
VVTASSWIGRTVDGRYRLEERLGTGSFGVTYRARHIEHQRIVALKLMHEYVSGNAAQRASFESEAMMLARVEHPSIVTLVHYGEHTGQPWVACEWLEGETLAQHMARGAVPLAAALGIVRQLLAALAAAHAARLVHRNVKPSNVMLERRTSQGRERVKLIDFAPALHTITPSTLAGMVSPYSPPELVAGEPLDARSDVFGVGATLIGLLLGNERDANDNSTASPRGLTGMHARALPGVDASLVAWIRRATSVHRPLRFANAAEALRELIDLLPRDVRSPSALSEAAGGARAAVDARAPRGNTKPVSPLPRLPSMSRSEIPPPPTDTVEQVEVPKAAAIPSNGSAAATSNQPAFAPPAPDSAPARASEPTPPLIEPREDRSDPSVHLEPLIPLAARAEATRGTLRPIEKRISSAITEPRMLPLLAAGVFAFLIAAFAVFMHQSSSARTKRGISDSSPAATRALEPIALEQTQRPAAPATKPIPTPARKPAEQATRPADSVKPIAPAIVVSSPVLKIEPAPQAEAAPPPPAATPIPAPAARSAVSIVAAPGRPPVRDPWAEPAPNFIKRWHELALNGAPGAEGTVKAIREYNRDHPTDIRGYLVIGQLYLNRFWRADCVETWTAALDKDLTARGAPELLPALLDMVAQGKAPALAHRLILKAYGTEALDPIDQAFGDVRNPEYAARLHSLRLKIMESAQGARVQ